VDIKIGDQVCVRAHKDNYFRDYHGTFEGMIGGGRVMVKDSERNLFGVPQEHVLKMVTIYDEKGGSLVMTDLLKFIEALEKAHFRTKDDTGAHPNAMMIWNRVRVFAGLEQLTLDDLPALCNKCGNYHKQTSACIFTRQYMIEKLIERNIESIRTDLLLGDESFLDSILRGVEFIQYNNMSDEQVRDVFQELINCKN
jgi:hypothetical protein